DNPSGDLRPPGGLLVVAHQRDTPVGCGGLRWLDDHVAEVTRVYVAEPARGHGLGTRLMAELERLARGHGRTTLRLDTRSDLTEARRLYADLGYRENAPYNPGSYGEHWFEKNLTGPARSARCSLRAVRDDIDREALAQYGRQPSSPHPVRVSNV